jgi:hypothetical protein
VADQDGDDAPDQVQVEQLHAQRAGDDRQRRDVAAEPQREQIPDLSVAIFGGTYPIVCFSIAGRTLLQRWT